MLLLPLSLHALPKSSVYLKWDVFGDTRLRYGTNLQIDASWGRYKLLYSHDATKGDPQLKAYMQTAWLKAGALQAHGLYARLNNTTGLHAWSAAFHERGYFSIKESEPIKASAVLSYKGLSAWFWQRANVQLVGFDYQFALPKGFDLHVLTQISYPNTGENESWFYDYGGKRIPLFHLASSVAYKNKILKISSDLHVSMGKLAPPRVQSTIFARVYAKIFTLKLLGAYSQERYRTPGLMQSREWNSSLEALIHASLLTLRYRFSWERHHDSMFHNEVNNQVGEHAVRLQIAHDAGKRAFLLYAAELHMLSVSRFDIDATMRIRLLPWRMRAEATWKLESNRAGDTQTASLLEHRYKVEIGWAKRGYTFSLSITALYDSYWAIRGKAAFQVPLHSNIVLHCSLESADSIRLQKEYWTENQAWKNIYAQFTLSFAVSEH